MGHPATKTANMARVVTLVDSCTFGTDWMTWDTSRDRDGWEDSECGGQRNVPELLAEQVEAADLLLINKIDLAEPEQVGVATSVAASLNSKAEVAEVKFGIISPQQILGNTIATIKQPDSSHTHDHHHDHDEPSSVYEPTSTDTSHDHSHNQSDCDDPTCTDPTHDHSHSHDHAMDETNCDDPTCTDPTHDHSHSHDHAMDEKKMGITSFVYKATLPFNSNRLLVLLNQWPVPIKNELDFGQFTKDDQDETQGLQDSPFFGVLRSKGFCWLAPTSWSGLVEDAWRHDTAMYWSHAGKHFGIEMAGKWWGSVSKEKMKQYFVGNEAEYDRILNEDWKTEEWGDRRQELVFIGVGIDEQKVTQVLNDCLCTEQEMEDYRAAVQELKNNVIE